MHHRQKTAETTFLNANETIVHSFLYRDNTRNDQLNLIRQIFPAWCFGCISEICNKNRVQYVHLQ